MIDLYPIGFITAKAERNLPDYMRCDLYIARESKKLDVPLPATCWEKAHHHHPPAKLCNFIVTYINENAIINGAREVSLGIERPAAVAAAAAAAWKVSNGKLLE